VNALMALAVARPGLSVLAAVELDCESQCGAIEVENVTPGWMLAAKLRVAELTVSQPLPQPPFDIGAVAPQRAGKFCFPGRAVEARHVMSLPEFPQHVVERQTPTLTLLLSGGGSAPPDSRQLR
jgi:hypothetical protein